MQSALRVRNKATRSSRARCSLKRHSHSVALQLDYYMSPQFAGIAAAVVNNNYVDKGIALTFLPICPVGLEQECVRINQNTHPVSVTMGSVEQNIFVPNLKRNPQLRTTAVAAMFHQSPLCLASIPHSSNTTIGTHEDTVEIMKRVFPDHDIIVSPRCSKVNDLLSGKLGAIQAYTTTEVPTLRRKLGEEPKVVLMEGHNGAKLGYSQVMFTADECLESDDKKNIVKAFCEATFDGWAHSISNPEQAVEMVREAKRILDLDDEENDHWHDSVEFELEFVQLCNNYVKETKISDGRYGVIDPSRWLEASNWMLEEETDASFGLDTSAY